MVDFHVAEKITPIGSDADGAWQLLHTICPACSRIVIFLQQGDDFYRQSQDLHTRIRNVQNSTLVYPRSSARGPVASQVPTAIAQDYREACLVLLDSPKASAALSRRCLQHVLRDAAHVDHGDLSSEIQQLINSGKLPTLLADSIDAVRITGNFSAHPVKSAASGEIVDVEPHEAEWNLDVLDSLFDYYYVQPAALVKKRTALNEKLKSAGKPPLKHGGAPPGS